MIPGLFLSLPDGDAVGHAVGRVQDDPVSVRQSAENLGLQAVVVADLEGANDGAAVLTRNTAQLAAAPEERRRAPSPRRPPPR